MNDSILALDQLHHQVSRRQKLYQAYIEFLSQLAISGLTQNEWEEIVQEDLANNAKAEALAETQIKLNNDIRTKEEAERVEALKNIEI